MSDEFKTREQIFAGVRECLVESLAVDPSEVTEDAVMTQDLGLASIDMLDLLRVKCRGNLSAEEEGLLERVLYQLRMLYVARTGSQG